MGKKYFIHSDTTVVEKDTIGCGEILGGALILAIIGGISAFVTFIGEIMGFIVGVVSFIVALIGFAIGTCIFVTLAIPFCYAMFFNVRSIVYAVRDAIKCNEQNRSETASRFGNFVRRFFGFIKDFLLYYCKHNAKAVQDRYFQMIQPDLKKKKRTFYCLAMVDVAFIAFGLPFILPLVLPFIILPFFSATVMDAMVNAIRYIFAPYENILYLLSLY